MKKDPEMTVSQVEIADAEMTKGEFGEEGLSLRLKPDAAEKFAQVTGNNIGKRLVVVSDGKALIAPTIQGAITGGSLRLTAGHGDWSKYLDNLP